MQLQLAEIILMVMWTLAGACTVFGSITQNPKYYVESLFGIEARWGKCAIGIFLVTFVIARTYQWASSENPTIYWGL